MKQTAVEFLQEALNIHFTFDQQMQFEGLFEQAKEMEKLQVINAFGVGCQVESNRLIGYQDLAEEYYNDTYKNN